MNANARAFVPSNPRPFGPNLPLPPMPDHFSIRLSVSAAAAA
ncbi:MAG: hypothetical protein ACRECV_02670 [Xanthobacteraceae bacterium]